MAGLEGLLGGVLGLAGKTAYYGAKGAWRVGSAIGKPAMNMAFDFGPSVAQGATAVAGRAAGFGLRHPEMVMGAAIAGVGVYAAMDAGAEDSELNEEEVDYLAKTMGSSTGFSPGQASYAYDSRRMAFIDSTYGLALGLHRGRHGG